jgi:hypothetical protein
MLLTEKNNASFLTFNFLSIEEKPLLPLSKAWALTLLGAFISTFGLLIQIRIYLMLQKQKKEGTVIVIDKLFKVHNLLNIFCYPLFIIYLVASYHLFPMVEYIGIFGCLFFSHFIQIFTTLYCLIFPLTIAILRFLFVVNSSWTKTFGVHKLVNIIVSCSILIPIFMTLSLQYPVSDYIHGPFSFCQGRFEVFFNPTHPDPITPGRREGERHCIDAQRWAFDDNTTIEKNVLQKTFRVAVFVSCKISRNLFYILTMSLPEMCLYPITFYHINVHYKNAATDGIIKADTIKRRNQQNLVNIYMTFWVWVAQFVTNMIIVVMVKYMFGKDQFVYQLVGLVTMFLNFNVLPCLYIVMGNDSFKRAILSKEYFKFFKLLFEF